MKSNGMFCKKIIDRYSLEGKYYFHGISLVFLKNPGRIFPASNGKAPLALLLQTFFTYWKYNRNGEKHIGNQAVYIRNLKQFMEIRMLLTPDYYLSAYEIEKRLLERLQKGQDVTPAQMEESEIFRAWNMGKALKEPFAAHKSKLSLSLSWENRRKYSTVPRLLSLDRNRKNSRQAKRWMEEELKKVLLHKSKIFDMEVNKEDGKELARITFQMKEELKERLLEILQNGSTEAFEWDALVAERISRFIVENAIENPSVMDSFILEQQTKAAQGRTNEKLKEEITQAVLRLKEELGAAIQAIPKEAAAEKLQENIKNEVKRIINSYKDIFDFSTDEISQLNEIAARYRMRRYNPISDGQKRTEFYLEEGQNQTADDTVRGSLKAEIDFSLDQGIIQELNRVLLYKRQENRKEESKNIGEETAQAVLRLQEELKTAIQGRLKEEETGNYQENLVYEVKRILTAYKEILDLNEKEINQLSERVSRNEIQRFSQIENDNKKETMSAGQAIKESDVKESQNIRSQKRVPNSDVKENQENGLGVYQEISQEINRVLLYRKQEKRMEESKSIGEETAQAVLRLQEELKIAIQGRRKEEETENHQENLVYEVKRILTAYKEILDLNEKEINQLSERVSRNKIQRFSQIENDTKKETRLARQAIKETGLKESRNIRSQKQISGSDTRESQKNGMELMLYQEISQEINRVLLYRKQEKRMEESKNIGEETAQAVLRLKEELKTAIQGRHKEEETENLQENLVYEVKRILTAYKEILDLNEKEINQLSERASRNEIQRFSQIENDTKKETSQKFTVRGETRERLNRGPEPDEEMYIELERVLLHQVREKRADRSQAAGKEAVQTVLRLKEELQTVIKEVTKEEAAVKFQENIFYEVKRILHTYKKKLKFNEKEIIRLSSRVSKNVTQRFSQTEDNNKKISIFAGQSAAESGLKDLINFERKNSIAAGEIKQDLESQLDQEISTELNRTLLHRSQENQKGNRQAAKRETALAVVRLTGGLKTVIVQNQKKGKITQLSASAAGSRNQIFWQEQNIIWNHSLAYEPVVQKHRKQAGEIKSGEKDAKPLEETKILKKQIYASKEMAQQQDKKILNLEKQLESQKAKMEETIYQAEKNMELNTIKIKNITARVIDEMQRQLRLEKMRRGMD